MAGVVLLFITHPDASLPVARFNWSHMSNLSLSIYCLLFIVLYLKEESLVIWPRVIQWGYIFTWQWMLVIANVCLVLSSFSERTHVFSKHAHGYCHICEAQCRMWLWACLQMLQTLYISSWQAWTWLNIKFLYSLPSPSGSSCLANQDWR